MAFSFICFVDFLLCSSLTPHTHSPCQCSTSRLMSCVLFPNPHSEFPFLKIRVHCYFVFLKALMDLEKKDPLLNEIDPPHHSCSFLPHSSTPEPSQQSASPLSAAESLESPGSNRPVVAGLRSAAAFKPVGSTSVKSPSWQRPNQAGIP